MCRSAKSNYVPHIAIKWIERARQVEAELFDWEE